MIDKVVRPLMDTGQWTALVGMHWWGCITYFIRRAYPRKYANIYARDLGETERTGCGCPAALTAIPWTIW